MTHREPINSSVYAHFQAADRDSTRSAAINEDDPPDLLTDFRRRMTLRGPGRSPLANRRLASAAVLAVIASTAALATSEDPIVGLWEGHKLDARAQVTEPWGPFDIRRQDDGTLLATYLGSRLGQRDQPARQVRLEGHRLTFTWGAARFEGELRHGVLTGTLRHHGLAEDFELERIRDRSSQDILALLDAGEIASAPPVQSEWMHVLVRHGPRAARRLYDAVRTHHPERRTWGASALNAWGYELLNRGETARAVDVLRFNVLAYPRVANSFDSLGEALLRNGEREPAIQALRTALSLRPRPEVRGNSLRLLRELGVEP